MPSLSIARAANAAFSVSGYRPTALFVGGTSGVGEGTAAAFAQATKGNAHILICGRNRANAEKIMAKFPKTPQSQYEFVECDATLMMNVIKAAEDVKSRLGTGGTINYLVLSQGIGTMKGFDPTSEGIDTKLALHFYSRWKFVDELSPCLDKAAAANQEARVMSIFAPGTGGPLYQDDLGLKKNFTLSRAARQASTYNDIMVDEYSKRHPSMSFIHIRPGFVKTSLGNSLHWSIRLPMHVLSLAATSIQDCGEWMTLALTSSAYKQGGFYLDQRAEPIAASKINSSEETRAVLVAHYDKEVAPA